MQALLDDLAKADSLYEQMYESSVNSANSAMNENEIYMQSLEARIKLARVEVEKLALAIGEAFLQEGMIQALQVFSSIVQAVSKFISVFGILPSMFGGLIVSLGLFSRRFREVLTNLGTYISRTIQSTKTLVANKLATDRLTASKYRLNRANQDLVRYKGTLNTGLDTNTKKLNANTKAMEASTKATKMAKLGMGVLGVASIAVGFGLEFLLNKMAESREKAEELENYNKNLAESYKGNADTINELSKKYEELSDRYDAGLIEENSQEYKEYLDVQKQLAELMPELVIGEDANGRAIIASSEIVKGHIEILKERLEIEKQLQREENISSAQDRFKTASKDLKKAEKEMNKIMDLLTLNPSNNPINEINNVWRGRTSFIVTPDEIKSYDDLIEKIEEVNKKKAEIQSSDENYKNNADYLYLETLSRVLSSLVKNYNDNYKIMTNSIKLMRMETKALVNEYISGNENMTKETKNFSLELFNAIINTRDSADELKKIQDLAENLKLNKDFSKDIENFDKALKSVLDADGDIEELQNKLNEAFEILKTNILEESGLVEGSEQYLLLSEALDKVKESKTEVIEKAKEYAETNKVSLKEALLAVTKAMDDSRESLGGLIDNFDIASASIEDIIWHLQLLVQFGRENEAITLLQGDAYKKVADEVSPLNKLLEDLAEGKSISAHEAMELIAKEEALAEAISIENGQIKVNIEAVKELRDTKIKSYNDMVESVKAESMTVANSTLSKLKNWKFELEAIQNLQDAKKRLAEVEELRNIANSGMGGWEQRDEINKAYSEIKDVIDLHENLERLQEMASQGLNVVGTSLEKTSSSTKNSNSATKQSIYLTDEYRQALEKLNAEIKKQQELQKQFPNWSEEYRKSLEKQIKLEREKLKLQREQAKTLESQIKSGKIQQTGRVSLDSPTTTKLSGWNGRVSSNYGYRNDPITGKRSFHNGIDIAMPQGTRLDSNVSGKIIKAGSHGTYGNLVVVQDASGMEHYFAHLEKVIAQVGDEIVAGQQIGTIGSTGRSTGSHLHYEVRVNGKAIDPTQFVNDAKNGIVSVLNGAQESIDQAKLTLYSLQSEIASQEQNIIGLENQLIDSYIAHYDRRRKELDKITQYEQTVMKTLDDSSQIYVNSLQKQIDVLNEKRAVNEEELAYLEDLIKNSDLTEVKLAELDDRINELSISNIDLLNSIKDLNAEAVNSSMSRIIEDIDNLEYAIERSKTVQELMNEGSSEYNSELEKQLVVLQEIKNKTYEQREELKRLMVQSDLTEQQYKQFNEQVEDLSLEFEQLRTEIQQTFFAMSEMKFKINDDEIQKIQDEIDLLNYKLQFIDEEDYNTRINIYADIKTNLETSVSQYETALRDVIIERNDALARGFSTELYDNKINEYIQARRNQFTEMQSIYNNMQSMVQDAFNKIAEAEQKAYQEASEAIDRAINESERRIRAFDTAIGILDERLSLLQESNFDERLLITEDQLNEAKRKANQIVSEYNRIANTPVYNEEQKERVQSQLESLRNELAQSNQQIIEYTKSLEQISFNKLISGANKSQKEIDRLRGRLQSNLKLMEGGLLSGTQLDFSFYMPQGNVLDLSTLIENPIDSLKNHELSVRDIRSSSYGQQIKDAERFYEEMKKRAEEFYKVMTEQIERFERMIQLLLQASNKDQQKEKEKSNEELLKETQNMTKEELQELKAHYQRILDNMMDSMGDYRDEYSHIWDDIVSDLQRKIQTIESVIQGADLELPEVKTKTNSSSSGKSSSSSGFTNVVNTIGSGLKKGLDSIKGLFGFADGTGTEGVPFDTYAWVNEEGRELIIYPDGNVTLSSSSNAHVDKLAYLPKGTHVIPNKETNEILNNLPKYAKGTKFSDINVRKLFDRASEQRNLDNYIKALQENTDAIEQFTEKEKTNLSNLQALLELYKDPKYKNDLDTIKDSITTLIDDLTPTFKNVDKYLQDLEKENKNKKEEIKEKSKNITIDEAIKNIDFFEEKNWEKMPEEGAGFSVGTSFQWNREAVKTLGNVYDIYKRQLLDEHGSTKEAISIVKSALNIPNLKGFEDYWTPEEIVFLQYLLDNVDYLRNGKPSKLKDDDTPRTGYTYYIGEDKIISDEHGALKYEDKKIGDTVIKGNYITSKEASELIKKYFTNQFAVDDEGKIYEIGQSIFAEIENQRAEIRRQENQAKQENKQAISKIEEIRESNPLTDIDLEKLGEQFKKDNQHIYNEIERLQKLLDEAEQYDNKGLIDSLSKEILSLQDELNIKTYNFLFDNIIELTKQSREIAEGKMQELKDMLENEHLTEETIAQIQQEIINQQQIIDSSYDMQKDAVNEWFNSFKNVWNREVEDISREIDNLEFELDMLDESDLSNRLRLQSEISKKEQDRLELLYGQKDQLEEMIKRFDVGTYEWNLLNDAIKDTENAIKDATRAIKNSKKELENTVDDILDTIKDALRKQRDLEVSELKKRLDEISKIYDEALSAIDDRESERTFERERKELQDEIANIEKQIDIWSLDDSQEGIARRLDLEKQLKEKLEELDELEYKRGVELEKKALEESRDRHREKLEDQIEDVEWYYNELIANDRKFAKIREDILNGNLTTANIMLQDFLQVFNRYASMTAEEIDKTFKQTGQSFQELLNMIDRLTEAYRNLTEIENAQKIEEINELDSKIKQNEPSKYNSEGFYYALVDGQKININKNDTDSIRSAIEHGVNLYEYGSNTPISPDELRARHGLETVGRGSKKVYTMDELQGMKKSDLKKILQDENSYLLYKDTEVHMPDIAKLSDDELERKYGISFSNSNTLPSHIQSTLDSYQGNTVQVGGTSYNWKYAKQNPEFMERVIGEILKERKFLLFENGVTREYKFKDGGMTTHTGLHWLDGTLGKPEMVLNADDTQNLLNAVNLLKDITDLVKLNIPKINIPIPNNLISNSSGDTNYNLTLEIANFNGTKKEAKDTASIIMNTIKKMGR